MLDDPHLATIEKLTHSGSWQRRPGELCVSPNLFRLFGLELVDDPETTFFQGVVPKIHEADRPSLMAFIAGLGDEDQKAIRFRAAVEGEEHVFSVRAQNIGEIRYGVLRNVTEQARAENLGRVAREDFRNLAESLPIGIYRGSYDGRMLYANAYLRDLLRIDDLEAFEWRDVLHPDDLTTLDSWFATFVRDGEAPTIEFRVHIDGKTKFLEADISRLGEGDENISYVIDRSLALERSRVLAERERQLEWSQRIGMTGSWRVEFDGVLNKVGEPAQRVHWSPELFHILGRDPETFRPDGNSFAAHIAPESQADSAAVIEAAMKEGKSWDYKTAMIRSDGEKRWMRAVGEPVFKNGQLIEMRGVVQDISESLELEDRVRRAEKMQALGELAGGIAHDFNNLLAAILGNAELLAMNLDGEALLDCKEIIQTARRCGDLTNQLLAFSRRSPLESREFDISQSIESVIKLVQHAVVSHIDFSLDVEHGAPLVAGEASQIDNALLNIALNAIQAMRPKGGTLRFRVRPETLVADEWPDDFDIREGPAVRVDVSDSGAGIDPELIDRVVEPFFTTRRDKGGTGLGLSTAYGTVRNHGGGFSIQSSPGEGTTVSIVLPAAAESTTKASDFDPEAVKFAGLSALVVDDEIAVRRVLTRHLESFGIVVDSAGGHREALELIRLRRELDDSYDLGIFDLSMPDGLGTETSRIFQESWPSAASLIISGYDLSVALEAPHEEAVLQKPFTAQALARALVEVILKGGDPQ